MAVATDEKTSLRIRRVYQAPVAAVYAAWVDPEQMKRWMGPTDDFETTVTMDVRAGGRYRIVMKSPDGTEHRVSGTYREVVRDRKLVYTWAWESTPERESMVTVEFNAIEAGTEMLLTHERFADHDARNRHLQGWTGCLARLDRLFA
jgi:uncharacterized protein YndB with AHSA1/START domain